MTPLVITQNLADLALLHAQAALLNAQDAERLSWLAAQGDVKIQCFEKIPFGSGALVEVLDEDDTVIGRGDSLQAAIDDAKGAPIAGVAFGQAQWVGA